MPSIYCSEPASLLLTSRCRRVFQIRRLLQESSRATSVSAPALGENTTMTEDRASHFATGASAEYPAVFDKSHAFPSRLCFRLLLKLGRGRHAESLFSQSCHHGSRSYPNRSRAWRNIWIRITIQ